jgi:uncharacterized radical SAM protein YgiQ
MSSSPSRHSSAARRLTAFLPTTREEMDARGWAELDVLLINGDAYVDHPAFGAALIGRHLEAQGLRVGMIAQPRWQDTEDIERLGRPRLMVGITAGNLDSMLNRLTAQKKVRREDRYSPAGRVGQRPDRATIVYANLARRAFGRLPIVIGGIEASLRRVAHYDYWSDKVRRSVLLDAKADLLVFGMGERAVWEVARRLRDGEPIGQIKDVRGTAQGLRKGGWEHLEPSGHPGDGRPVVLPSYERVCSSKRAFSQMSRELAKESNPGNGRPLLQAHGDEAIYLNPPTLPLSTQELDELSDLPFQRAPHGSYREAIPAFETVRWSIVTSRGCFGGCAFCSLSEHEGRVIQSRSSASVLREVERLTQQPHFAGTISDLGGPTANMYRMGCAEPAIERACRRLSCLHPRICPNLETDHGPLLRLMKKVRQAKGVRQAFIASGIRYDLAQRSPAFVRALAQHHTGGQLSVAPEHSSDRVLAKMKKPSIGCYERFVEQFHQASEAAGKDQHLVPYFISGHPGSTLSEMVELALYLKRHGIRPRQVQEFIPTPMSLATSMYFTGLDPADDSPVFTPRDLKEKRLQKALLLYWDRAQHDHVREALHRADRADLIGSGPKALVPPAHGKGALPRHRQQRIKRRRRGKR